MASLLRSHEAEKLALIRRCKEEFDEANAHLDEFERTEASRRAAKNARIARIEANALTMMRNVCIGKGLRGWIAVVKTRRELRVEREAALAMAAARTYRCARGAARAAARVALTLLRRHAVVTRTLDMLDQADRVADESAAYAADLQAERDARVTERDHAARALEERDAIGKLAEQELDAVRAELLRERGEWEMADRHAAEREQEAAARDADLRNEVVKANKQLTKERMASEAQLALLAGAHDKRRRSSRMAAQTLERERLKAVEKELEKVRFLYAALERERAREGSIFFLLFSIINRTPSSFPGQAT